MKIAIISDIHGNLEGLTKAFEIIDAKGVEHVYCLGDIIGYGANPNECISMLRSRNVLSTIGNHDQAVIDAAKAGTFNDFARQAVDWTAQQVTQRISIFSLNFHTRSSLTIVPLFMRRRPNRKSGTTFSLLMKLGNSSVCSRPPFVG